MSFESTGHPQCGLVGDPPGDFGLTIQGAPLNLLACNQPMKTQAAVFVSSLFYVRGNREMAVPKRKHSNSRSGKRRSHHHIKAKQRGYCKNCGTCVPSHVVCPNCGYYMGRVVVDMADES